MTALDWAAAAGHNDVIHSLIQAGAIIDRKSKWVRT
jgi:ankyrin repeat protein